MPGSSPGMMSNWVLSLLAESPRISQPSCQRRLASSFMVSKLNDDLLMTMVQWKLKRVWVV
jgi:hypothetical protein